MAIPVTDLELDREYAANNIAPPKFEQPFIDSMRGIAKALTTKTQTKKALEALSNAMLAEYEKRLGGPLSGTLSARVKALKEKMNQANRDEKDKSRHLLTTVLTAFEKNEGFQTFAAVDDHPQIIQMTGLVSKAGFLGTIGSGYTAKDYVTREHGVYSHRIQWYIVGKIFAATLGPLAELFKKFQEGNAWLITFDRLPEHEEQTNGNRTIDSYDFRTPEKLHAYLQTDDAALECPLLANYIRSKESGLGKSISWISIKKICAARKLFPEKRSEFDGWKRLTKTAEIDNLLKGKLTAEELKELNELMVLKSKEDDLNANLLHPKPSGGYAKGAPQ